MTEEECRVNLKPCPKCGEKAYLRYFDVPVDGDYINMYKIGCEKCKIALVADWEFDEIAERWNNGEYFDEDDCFDNIYK